MIDLSPVAQAVLYAYRDESWTPDEEDNRRYYKFSHKAGMAAVLRAVADQVAPFPGRYPMNEYMDGFRDAKQSVHYQLLAIAAELEGKQ
jgi:hypothetical protein